MLNQPARTWHPSRIQLVTVAVVLLIAAFVYLHRAVNHADLRCVFAPHPTPAPCSAVEQGGFKALLAPVSGPRE